MLHIISYVKHTLHKENAIYIISWKPIHLTPFRQHLAVPTHQFIQISSYFRIEMRGQIKFFFFGTHDSLVTKIMCYENPP